MVKGGYGLLCSIQFIGLLVLGFLALIPLSACAYAVHGPTQTVPFSSTPTGAEVFIKGEPRGVTPLELELARNKSYDVVLKLGEQAQKMTIVNVPEGGNIALDVIPAGAAGTGSLLFCVTGSSSANDALPGLGTAFCLGGMLITAIVGTPIYVDAATGSWYQLSPGEVAVTFDQ